MADNSVKTICGTFSTREAAERAVEHLVQEHGIDRADIFVQPEGGDNSAGIEPSGADAAPDLGGPQEAAPALNGAILVSADVADGQSSVVESTLRSAGASDVRTR